jgi:APA family basic amino acid/polyamine antiporter
VGWNLLIEYAFCGAAVATTISSFTRDLLVQFGHQPPTFLFALKTSSKLIQPNLSTFLIVTLMTALLTLGVRSSVVVSRVITVLNVLTLSVVIAVGASRVDSSNWTPFMPRGFTQTLDGSFSLFFSYLGFDTLCTLSGEAKKPRRDIPVSMIGTLAIACTLYMGVGFVLTGVQPYSDIAQGNALQAAFRSVGLSYMGSIVGICKFITYNNRRHCQVNGNISE